MFAFGPSSSSVAYTSIPVCSTTGVDYWSEDASLLEGFIVISAGNVTWDFDFLNRERMKSAPELGTVSIWREGTDEPSA
jgi:hypothetical protein